MSTVKAFDSSEVLLILGSFVGVDNILQLSNNARYEFIPPADDGDCFWRGDLPEEEKLTPPFLCLTIGQDMFDPQGWVFGSHNDSTKCDIQLARNNQTGISHRCFRVDVDPESHQPRLMPLTQTTIQVHIAGSPLICSTRVFKELPGPATIELGPISFRAWAPRRTDAEKSMFHRLAQSFGNEALNAVPKYIPSIGSRAETALADMRTGSQGAVYVWDGETAGRGSAGTVMKVKDYTSGKLFGAKEPYWKKSDSVDVLRHRLEMLQKEFGHIVQLDHPNILKAYEVVMAEDITLPPWLIVEYIPMNLEEYLPSVREHEKHIILTHLSKALQYLHTIKMCHRDVKLANVLVHRIDQGLCFKLADFGSAKSHVAGEMDTFVWTDAYMAPELYIESRSYTFKVDMWCLGLIAMQLYTDWDLDNTQDWNPYDSDAWSDRMLFEIRPSMLKAPRWTQRLLKELLRLQPDKRWSASKCLQWLWLHKEEGSSHTNRRLVGDGQSTVISHSQTLSGPSKTNSSVGVNSEASTIGKKRAATSIEEPSSEHDSAKRLNLSDWVNAQESQALRFPWQDPTMAMTPTVMNSPPPELAGAATPHPDDSVSNAGDSEYPASMVSNSTSAHWRDIMDQFLEPLYFTEHSNSDHQSDH